jgi:hypothetical protein
MLWCVSHIVVGVVAHKTYCCNMSYVSQNWQQYVLHITSLKTSCLTHHNIDNNDILLSVLWCVRCIVVNVLIRKTNCCQCCDNKTYCWYCCDTKVCLTYNNTDCNMSYVSKHWHQYVLRITTMTKICLTYQVLWHVRHLVVIFVIRKTHCCQCSDTKEKWLSVLW